MDLTGLVTFWSLVLAAYAVLPEYWKLRIKAFIGPRGVISSTTVALLSSLSLVSWSMFMGGDGWKVIVQIAAFLVLLFYVAFLVIGLFRGRVTKNNLQRCRELVSSLSTSRQYEVLTKLLRDNIKYLPMIYNHKPRPGRPLLFKNGEPAIKELPWQLAPAPIYQEEVVKFVDQIISDNGFTTFVLDYDIDIPLSLIETCESEISGVSEYLNTILECLISKPGSQLYKEVQRNQNLDYTGRRLFNNSRLLKFLFGDAELASKRAIWKPVGDYVLRFICNRPGGPNDEYNRAEIYYSDPLTPDRFSCPVFVGLEFFDFMVKEALLQQVKWHMWLYYFRNWTKEMVEKVYYNPDEWERGYWEYPTRYAFLLYTMVDYQLGWFDCALENGLNISLEKGDIDINANILQSTAVCLACCLRTICECDQLTDRFKRSLLALWWKRYFKLNGGRNNYAEYAQFMLKSLVGEVEDTSRKQVSFPLLGCMISGLTHVDRVVVNQETYGNRLSDMKQLLQQHVVPVLKATPLELRSQVLADMLGTEFRLDGNTILVTDQFGPWTSLGSVA